MNERVQIRECESLEELSACVDLQREVFALPEIEISPVRHFVVTKNAGGFVLGAFAGDVLAGFVLSVPAFLRGEKAFYSHMTAVKAAYQSFGIGRRLKWAQRDMALALGISLIKWTFEPWRARNAFFNIEKLGALVSKYQANFYGIDYLTASTGGKPIGLASDRLFAEWHLESEKVVALADGKSFEGVRKPDREIAIVPEWAKLVSNDPQAAVREQRRIREEFTDAFADGLLVRRFVRDDYRPKYFLYKD